jgi:hypothetical protein
MGLLIAIWTLLPHGQDATAQRLDGSISSILAGTHTLLLQVQTLSEFAHIKSPDNEPDPIFASQRPMLQDNTEALQQLQKDGELYNRLSEPLQYRLPRFIQSRINIISTLNPRMPDLHQGGSLKLLRSSLEAEEKCFEAERRLQQGSISAKSHRTEVEAIMAKQLRELVGPGKPIPPGAELGPMMPVFVPDESPEPKKIP